MAPRSVRRKSAGERGAHWANDWPRCGASYPGPRGGANSAGGRDPPPPGITSPGERASPLRAEAATRWALVSTQVRLRGRKAKHHTNSANSSPRALSLDSSLEGRKAPGRGREGKAGWAGGGPGGWTRS